MPRPLKNHPSGNARGEDCHRLKANGWRRAPTCLAAFAAVVLAVSCAREPKRIATPAREPVASELLGEKRVEKITAAGTTVPSFNENREVPDLNPLPSPERIAQPLDPRPAVNVLFQVQIFQLALPEGTISRNDAFWKRVNEQALDPATYDILYRNGFRVGEAPFSDWEFFRTLIESEPGAVSRTETVSAEAKNIELSMQTDLPFQHVFFFDRRNVLVGRTFDRADNILSLSFLPTPRKPGWMRLHLAPVIRGDRLRFEYTATGAERGEVAYTRPEMFYDCNLKLDVPIESFIVVAPSPEAGWPVSLGHAFLSKQGKSEQFEQVLLIVPQPYRVKD